SGAILPIVGAASAAGQLAVRVLPIGEIGATLSAELAYVYDYLPFSRLHDRTGAGLAVSVSGFADRLSGDAGNDLLFGLLGADDLKGGSGDDQLSGGYGRDRVEDVQGANIFAFNRLEDSAASGNTGIVRQSLDVTAVNPAFQTLLAPGAVPLHLAIAEAQGRIGASSLLRVGGNGDLGADRGVSVVAPDGRSAPVRRLSEVVLPATTPVASAAVAAYMLPGDIHAAIRLGTAASWPASRLAAL